MNQRKTTEQQADDLNDEARAEYDRAQELLRKGEAFDSVEVELKAIGKEREAATLKTKALKEHETFLERHPVSSIPFGDDEPSEPDN